MFSHLGKQKLDPIMALNNAFKLDPNPRKINLIIGAYRCKLGKPYIFEAVKRAINKINPDYEYLPIIGDQNYLLKSKQLYGLTNYDSVQTLSGTGGLKLSSELLKYSNKIVYLPDPTWGNHYGIFGNNLFVSTYQYLDNKKFNFGLLIDSIKKIPNNNIILLHSSSHNPSGYDPTELQWREILNLIKKKNLFTIVDCAYLGFGSGDVIKDGILLKLLNENYHPSLICTSYAKNFGLYNQRVGNLFFNGQNNQELDLIRQNLTQIIRESYSSPPSHGSSIIAKILEDNELTKIWKQELVDINKHYVYLRQLLKKKLEDDLNQDFSDIIQQNGMFYYSKFTPEQIIKMQSNGLYFLNNGRMSLAGINDRNIDDIITIIKSNI
jgi:aspartate/tyrosine/aromatic aminotransferase